MQRGAISTVDVSGVVDEPGEAVDRLEPALHGRGEEPERDGEVLARRLGQDLLGGRRAGRRSGRRGRDGEPALGHQSPETWMKTLRARARSSSQKKIFCQRPSIGRPATMGIAWEVDDSNAARRCEWPFG